MKFLLYIIFFTGMCVARYKAIGQVAIYTGGSGDGYASAGFIGAFFMGGNGDGYATQQITVPLPIHLLAFKATRINDRSVLIEWKAETDAQHDRFELERSFNGMNYKVINVKQNLNNNTATVSYAVTDTDPVADAPSIAGKIIVYYRLRPVDKDGSFTYSPVQRVIFDPTGNLLINKVYPNPAKGMVYVETITTAAVTYTLFDSHGKTAATGNFTGNTTLNFSHLAAGGYWLRAESNSKQETIRIDIVR